MSTSNIHIEPTGSKIGAIVHNVDLDDKSSSEVLGTPDAFYPEYRELRRVTFGSHGKTLLKIVDLPKFRVSEFFKVKI